MSVTLIRVWPHQVISDHEGVIDIRKLDPTPTGSQARMCFADFEDIDALAVCGHLPERGNLPIFAADQNPVGKAKSMEPSVSVILPAYKMGPYIGEALRSVAAQVYQHWEVIVVDDHAPEDGTLAIVEAFAAAHPDKRVEFMRHERNMGVSAARNTGITAARGEYLAFLDPDDLWLSHHLSIAMRLLGGKDQVDVVCGPVESFRDEPGRSWSHKALFEPWKTRNFPHSLAVYNFIQPSAVVVRRSAVQALSGFDTDPAIQHIEDYDLWIRLVEGGYRFAFLSAISARYRKHAAAATEQSERFKALQALLYSKHEGFFREGLRRMNRMAHEGLHHAQQRERGPIMATILWVDDILGRMGRKLTGRN